MANVLIISAKSLNCGWASIKDCPSTNNPWEVKILFIPINNPAATRIGSTGTKTSAKDLINLWTGFSFLSASFFNSSLLPSAISAILISSL